MLKASATLAETPNEEPAYIGIRTDRMEDQEMSDPPNKTEMSLNKNLPMVALHGNKMEEDPSSM